jgi:bleomycin hydrolase
MKNSPPTPAQDEQRQSPGPCLSRPLKAQSKSKSKPKPKSKAHKGVRNIRKVIKAQKELTNELFKASEDRLIKTFETRCAPAAEPLTDDQMTGYSGKHSEDPINRATENALATVPVSWLAENRSYIQQVNYSYSHLPDHCPRPTQQAHSGRCWLFAALNTIRYNLIQRFHLSERFELSEAYLFFYDKIERSLFFLEKMLEFRDSSFHDVEVNGMTTYFSPVSDGGTWSFFTNLISRYGIVPKSCYGEAFNSSDTTEMNAILYQKLSQFVKEIRSSKFSNHTIQKTIREKYMPEVYSLMVKFLGEPPKKFDWNYHEAGDNFEGIRERGTYRSVKDLTPLTFHETLVEPEMRLRNKIILRHDPRSTSPYYRTYKVNHFGSMVGGKPEVALNVPWEVLSKTAASAVMSGEPLWFSADVEKSMSYGHGILSTEAFDYEKALNTSIDVDKAFSLDTHVSGPTHAMALVGVDVLDNDPYQVRKWKVENSWGESSGGQDPGYFMMTEDWFKKYGYEVVVDLDLLDDRTRDSFLKYEFDPLLLPFNDAFGAVARKCTACCK